MQGAQTFDGAYQVGITALNKNDLATARSQLETAAELQPANPRVWLALTQTYWKQNDKAAADGAARKAESLGATDQLVQQGLAVYYFEVAQTFLNQQQFDAAVPALAHGLHISPNNAQLELALGVAYYGQRRFSDAVSAFLRTIDLAPEVEQPYLFLGRMLDQAGDRLPEITRRFEHHAAADPRDPLALFLYAKALIASDGDQAKAEKLLRDSIVLKGDQWDSHYELGVLLEKQRRFSEAAGELERAIAIEPNRAEAHYHLARVDDRLGETDKAAEQRSIHQRLTAQSGIK